MDGVYKIGNGPKLYGDAEALIKAISGTITSVEAQLAVKDLPTVQPYRHPAGYGTHQGNDP